MIYCTKCGTQFEGRFCPNCGTPADVPMSSVPPPVTPVMQGVPSNWASVLCYLVPIAGPLVFLFLAPYNRDPRIRFDGWQALFLQLAWMAAHIVANVFQGISWRLADIFHELIALAYFVAVVVLIVKAFQGQKLVLPVIGPLAEKQR